MAPIEWPAISRIVWERRYRWNDEPDVAATLRRVARAVASAEPAERGRWAAAFEQLLRDFAFLPGGRILAGAGTDREVTLANCFVMGLIPDSAQGARAALEEGVLTLRRGGGVGYDFSTLRPGGNPARGDAGAAPGPIAAMLELDAACATLDSVAARGGAMMGTLRCDHPDIEAFIDAKRDPAALRHFNLSVQVTDAFMAAVADGADWPLVFPASGAGSGPVLQRRWSGSAREVACEIRRVVPARDLWERLLRAAYDTSEPGVLFVDQINRENNLHWREQLTSTNPCGEIPLPPYGACVLGSLNLVQFVLDPFEPGARLDSGALAAAARLAVRFMDDVIDISTFPLEGQAREARATRRVGIGITGLADALAMLGQRYDAWTARGVAVDFMRTIAVNAYAASIELARERGAFPSFDRDRFLAGAFVRRLPASLREGIAAHGKRNSHLLAIAPAGTISLLAGNVSSGIEPIAALESTRQVREPGGRSTAHAVRDHAAALWQSMHAGQPPAPGLVTVAAIDGAAQIAMQAALQPWVDHAISKTVTVAAELPFAAFRTLYEQAFRSGLKGCTVYRPTALRGAVLTPKPATG